MGKTGELFDLCKGSVDPKEDVDPAGDNIPTLTSRVGDGSSVNCGVAGEAGPLVDLCTGSSDKVDNVGDNTATNDGETGATRLQGEDSCRTKGIL